MRLRNHSIADILNIGMRKLLRVSDRHQITLPPSAMKDAGLREGSYVAVRAEKGKIVLEPVSVKAAEWMREDWDKLDDLVASQVRSRRFTDYPSPKEAKKHLK